MIHRRAVCTVRRVKIKRIACHLFAQLLSNNHNGAGGRPPTKRVLTLSRAPPRFPPFEYLDGNWWDRRVNKRRRRRSRTINNEYGVKTFSRAGIFPRRKKGRSPFCRRFIFSFSFSFHETDSVRTLAMISRNSSDNGGSRSFISSCNPLLLFLLLFFFSLQV